MTDISIEQSDKSVDIIMPTYNSDVDLLKRAIESVIAQDFPNWTLFVARDGGKIEIASIVDAFGDHRIKYLDLPHKGKAATLNTTIAHGKGCYIAYLDDDDLWYPNHLSVALKALAIPGISLVHTDAWEIFLQTINNQTEEKTRRILNRGAISNATCWYISHISTVHTRELYESVGNYDETRSFFIDWDMLLRMSNKSKPYHVDLVTCEHYIYLNENNCATNTISSVHQAKIELSNAQHKEMFKRAFSTVSPDDFAEIVTSWQDMYSRLQKQEPLTARIRFLEEELLNKEQELHANEQILNTKDSEISQLNSYIDQLKRSLSWKITAPLRAIYDKIPLAGRQHLLQQVSATQPQPLHIFDDGKECVCIIAPRLPEFDRASGDLRLYRIIEILSERYNVYFFNDGIWEKHFREGNTAYYDAIVNLGASYLDNISQFQHILRTNHVKVIICEFYHLAQRYLDITRATSAFTKFIVDSVDVHFFREQMMGEALKDTAIQKEAAKTKITEIGIYRKADQIWTVSDYDMEAILREGVSKGKIQVVPNIHNVPPPPPTFDERDKNTLLFIGGFSHAPNVDAVNYFAKEVLPLIHKRVPSTRLLVVGDSPPPSIRELNSPSISVLGYVPDTHIFLNSAMISVAPLRFGAGLKGKVGEALAAGIPVVTTNVGAQGMCLVSGKDCLIADTPTDFADAVVNILTNSTLWSSLSMNGQQFMRENFGYERIKEKLFAALSNVQEEAIPYEA